MISRLKTHSGEKTHFRGLVIHLAKEDLRDLKVSQASLTEEVEHKVVSEIYSRNLRRCLGVTEEGSEVSKFKQKVKT